MLLITPLLASCTCYPFLDAEGNARVLALFAEADDSFIKLQLNDINPNTFAGLVGKVQKKLSPEGGRKEGRWEKKARAVCPPGPGSNPGPAAW